jgi:hypothetical protein
MFMLKLLSHVYNIVTITFSNYDLIECGENKKKMYGFKKFGIII